MLNISHEHPKIFLQLINCRFYIFMNCKSPCLPKNGVCLIYRAIGFNA